jgi:hypothetical protein
MRTKNMGTCSMAFKKAPAGQLLEAWRILRLAVGDRGLASHRHEVENWHNDTRLQHMEQEKSVWKAVRSGAGSATPALRDLSPEKQTRPPSAQGISGAATEAILKGKCKNMKRKKHVLDVGSVEAPRILFWKRPRCDLCGAAGHWTEKCRACEEHRSGGETDRCARPP